MPDGKRPQMNIDNRLHGAMKDVSNAHERDVGDIYSVAAKLVVRLDTSVDDYCPNDDPLLNDYLNQLSSPTCEDNGQRDSQSDRRGDDQE